MSTSRWHLILWTMKPSFWLSWSVASLPSAFSRGEFVSTHSNSQKLISMISIFLWVSLHLCYNLFCSDETVEKQHTLSQQSWAELILCGGEAAWNICFQNTRWLHRGNDVFEYIQRKEDEVEENAPLWQQWSPIQKVILEVCAVLYLHCQDVSGHMTTHHR